ncbi:ABC transporter substrate-binding protein [Streptomyces radicis]|uniref:ABC transporter substrate-binding protein n=1 Tax=Streptomyces radicis TaxID=1750517 RepID=A0A3A9VT02_9ACTN|nr:ABC transporter substrate-binding protein [Streptomyces radicis]RKN04018.1 ABC transporter substrate-binding protein [Streptomyces radicis]RKN14197.1 ABC transporter substrate-binding protein [Streptomyces radicis]
MRAAALTRRRLVAAGGALGAATTLAACGGEGGGDTGDGSGNGRGGDGGSGAWTFTDDRDETVTLDARPETLVAYVGSASALADYGITCAGVFGPTLLADGEPDVQAANLDVDALTVVGNAWGEFNIETYARLEPDLLISDIRQHPDLWYVPEDSADDILGLAPGVGILGADTTLRTMLERYAELAAALGADLRSAPVTEARERFDAAAESLRRAASDNPGIRVLALSATEDKVWFAVPADLPDLAYFAELGVAFVTPESPDPGGVWQSVSWENADLLPADLILVDSRTGNLQPDQLADTKPTWNGLPAVRAGQVVSWAPEPASSYAHCAPIVEGLARAVRDAAPTGA